MVARARDAHVRLEHDGVADSVAIMRIAAGFGLELRGFLSRTNNLKSIADYETAPDAEVSVEQASSTLTAARQFVAWFENVLTTPSQAAGASTNDTAP